ncbi:MAG: hypothetical protein II149_00865 [Clostridia bacterium]|nr:hypothetical protein [Clostridia bacterium]MBQ6172017.1 hypothetical protein [Clostridia bacterium]
MGNITDTKESKAAQNFLLKSKDAFSEKILRNTVKDIDISECVQDETYASACRFNITGSVETESPTGKARTYLYHATVDVADKKENLVSLNITPLEG